MGSNPTLSAMNSRDFGSKHRFMAVYPGVTLAEANRMLAVVKATENFRALTFARCELDLMT